MAVERTRRYAKGAAREAQILAATVDLIFEQGISAVSHRRVARRADVPLSAPGYFFPSIDELVLAAFRSIMTSMLADHDALSERIRREDMDRERAVDAYIDLITRNARKYDHLQYEAYLFANHRPALREAVDETIAATIRPDSTIVTASRRDDLGWAAPILTALADGCGLHRVASASEGGGFEGLREGLLALMEALPGRARGASSPGGASDADGGG